jgi:diguanylate cyclase (GGDEF)-like protein/PAS domain S-box-containing protein
MSVSRPAASLPEAIQGPISTSPSSLVLPRLGFEVDASIYRGILDHIEDGVYFVDRQKRIQLWNRGAQEITGYSPDEVVGDACGHHRLCHADDSGRLLCTNGCLVQVALDTGVPMEADAFLLHKLGHRVPVRIKTSPLRDSQNRLVGAVEIFHSRSELRHQDQLIAELAHLAMIDDLTRLPNRRHFDMQLDRRLAELNRFGWSFGTLMIDLDDFKHVNDTFGHQTGDEVLQLVARTLAANCRSLDTVARWGGEEFAAIIANVHEDELRKVAEKLRAMVDVSSLPRLGTEPLRTTVSIGCAIARPNETAAELIKRTDEMLYAAKRGGRNQVRP